MELTLQPYGTFLFFINCVAVACWFHRMTKASTTAKARLHGSPKLKSRYQRGIPTNRDRENAALKNGRTLKHPQRTGERVTS